MKASIPPSTGCPLKPFTNISILDCPEQNHTSPINTLSNSSFSPSDTATVYGPPASGVWTRANHLPSASDSTTVFDLSHDGRIVTFDDGLAVPQKATDAFLCSTILSPKTDGITTLASTENAMNTTVMTTENILFIIYLLIGKISSLAGFDIAGRDRYNNPLYGDVTSTGLPFNNALYS